MAGALFVKMFLLLVSSTKLNFIARGLLVWAWLILREVDNIGILLYLMEIILFFISQLWLLLFIFLSIKLLIIVSFLMIFL